MKRRISVLFLAVMLLSILSACSTDRPQSTPEPTAKVVASGDCFEVTGTRSDGVTRYAYTVRDKSGNELESAVCSEQPRVAVINKDLLGIRFYVDGKTFCRYYDLKNSRVSESFFNAFWDNGKLVAYHDYSRSHSIVVREIFDPDGYRAEQKLDLPALTITITACEQDEESGEITVKYIYGDLETEGSVVLPTRPEK